MRMLLPFLVSAFLAQSTCAQPLDWAGDVTVFGTVRDERQPALLHSGSSVLHAFCVLDGDTLAMKRSADNGLSWSGASKRRAAVSSPVFAVTSDPSYAYVLCYAPGSAAKRLFRLAASASEWASASEFEIAPERAWSVKTMAAVTDAVVHPDDAFLNVCWVERDAGGVLHTVFAQSRDRGTSFLPAVTVQSASSPSEMPVHISIATTWSGEEQRLHVAVPVDRLGSTPEELRLYSSTDQGAQWSAGAAVDPSVYPQRTPSLAGYGNTLLLVFARRSDAAAQRDVYFTYSPDGGQTFAPVQPVTDHAADEYDPRIVVDTAGDQFHIFYFVSAVLASEATLMVRSGSVSAPWQIGLPVAVNEPNSAYGPDGYSVMVGTSGVAAVWSAPFPLGDFDVLFDASWRGMAVQRPDQTDRPSVDIGGAYPNPFNATTRVPFTVRRAQHVQVLITDVLGRTVASLPLGVVPPGERWLHVDLSGHSSGAYWLSVSGAGPPRPLLLTK